MSWQDVVGDYTPLVRILVRPSIAQIRDRVAEYFGAKVADVVGPRRMREITVPRQAGMYLARKITGRSYPQIGKVFGNRDHTTVMHGCKVTAARMHGNDYNLAPHLAALEESLRPRQAFDRSVRPVCTYEHEGLAHGL